MNSDTEYINDYLYDQEKNKNRSKNVRKALLNNRLPKYFMREFFTESKIQTEFPLSPQKPRIGSNFQAIVPNISEIKNEIKKDDLLSSSNSDYGE